MSNALIPTTFSSPLFGDVRTVRINDEPWFVAADIARILEHATAKDLARNIKKEYRGRQILPTSSGDQEMVVISTPGLFHALMGAVMFWYRITDGYYQQIKAQIIHEAPAA